MMKKLFLALALTTAVGVQAQSVKFGVVAGVNVSKIKMSDALKTLSSDNRAGWYIGPKVNISTPFGLGFDASLQYSQKKLDFKDVSSKTFRSVEIPINLRYHIGLGSLASVYLATGPQFGFNVGNKDWSISRIGNIGQNFEKRDMNTSWNIGAGVSLLEHLELGLVYNIALSKYYKGAGSTSGDYSFKSNSFQVQLAYMF